MQFGCEAELFEQFLRNRIIAIDGSKLPKLYHHKKIQPKKVMSNDKANLTNLILAE